MAEVEIPKQCKAGVVVNEGPDFRVEVQMVDVPEPGILITPHIILELLGFRLLISSRPERCLAQTQLHRPLHVRCPFHVSLMAYIFLAPLHDTKYVLTNRRTG